MSIVPTSQVGNLFFRKMCESDLDGVLRNETRAYAFPWTRGIFKECLNSRYHSSVMHRIDASNQKVLIGHSVLSVAAGEAHLLNVCVSKDFQGQGHGRALVVYMLDKAGSLGVDVVFLEVRPSNRAAVALYNSLGFSEIGLRKNYYPAHIGHEDAKVFALQLGLGAQL